MTAEAWVAVLTVACVGLTVMTAASIVAWWRARTEVDEAICDREYVWGVAWETAEQRDAARAALAMAHTERDFAQQLLEFTEADVQTLNGVIDYLVEAVEEGAAATRVALIAYGRVLTIAEQSGLQYANVRDELEGVRAENDELRAAADLDRAER